MMSALSQLYNQSLGNVSRVPLPSQIKTQGWILWLVGFRGGHHKRAFFDIQIFDPMPIPIASPSPPTESMKTLRSVPMNNVSMRLSMAPSLSLFCLQQEAWEIQPPFAIRGWPL